MILSKKAFLFDWQSGMCYNFGKTDFEMSEKVKPKKRKRKGSSLSYAGTKVRRWLGAMDTLTDSIIMLQNISFRGFTPERLAEARELWERFTDNLLDSRSALFDLGKLIEADMPKPRQGRK